MLTYDLSKKDGAIYERLYEFIKEDICNGNLKSNQRMPSKRTFAKNMGVSIITVENTYELLMSEGYLYSLPKKGYFVSELDDVYMNISKEVADLAIHLPQEKEEYIFDFSSNRTRAGDFPFSIWAKLMRDTISLRETELLKGSFCGGVLELRQAIANHLSSFRGMIVDPNQIIVGAGTEYLYGLLIKLLGMDKVYGVENPGYRKIYQIYESNGVSCVLANLDENGISVDELKCQNVDVAHTSPNHHFPTGITMSLNRRYELLNWANENSNRYIIEDDYDSEFRLKGKPLPTLFSIDKSEKVVYMNTFSKSLASTIRISYMVLPRKLANLYYERMSFYSCTVSTFEQYTLAEFISRGYFEKHINRMRLQYGKKRARIQQLINLHFVGEKCRIIENDSGLHFILEFVTDKTDVEIEEQLKKERIHISAVTDFDMHGQSKNLHQFILNYSNMDEDMLEIALSKLVL